MAPILAHRPPLSVVGPRGTLAAMSLNLIITPTGRITAIESSGEVEDQILGVGEAGPAAGLDRRAAKRLASHFAASPAEGLFVLAAEPAELSSSPPLAYWREFAARYLVELCRASEASPGQFDEIPCPASSDLAALRWNAPPMRGGEYLTEDMLATAWSELDTWVRHEASTHDDGLAGFLKDRAPLWHQVGRICFHLAENRRDPDYPFAFLATYAPGLTRGARVQYQPLSNALRQSAGARDNKTLVRLLSPVQRAAEQSGLVRELVESGDLYQPLAWTPNQAHRFLTDVPVFESSGILVRVPDWWKKRARPTVSVTIGDRRQKKLDQDALLDFRVHLALGDQELTEDEWRQLMAAEQGLVLLRGQWVEVDRDRLTQVLDHWKHAEQAAQDGISFVAGMRLLAGASADLSSSDGGDSERQWSFVQAGAWLGQVLEGLRDPGRLAQTRPGVDLRATLRPYQEIGVNWLWFLSQLGLGACLADDMGLGKTIQVLALLALMKRMPDAKSSGAKPSLLVVPASLLANWKSEMQRFAPTLRGRFVHPSETPRDELERMAALGPAALRDTDVVFTTYAMLHRQPWLLEIPWQLAVIDEAQAIKNPTARQTKAVKRLKAGARLALTGTPVENRLSDLWSLFDFLCPGLLGSQAKFKEFVKTLDSPAQHGYAPLRRLVQPYILRRLKTDKQIIADLPDKTEVRAFCGLSKRQAALYAKLVDELARGIRSLDGIQRRGLVLTYLMRFKQVCNHPSQLLGDGQYAPDDSGKFSRLAELCDEIASRQEKALVFTQFREMTEPLAARLAEIFGRPGLVLHGSVAVARRRTLVEQFQRDDGPPFFVLSLKAGGTGLNLTQASHVIHFDRWWNPAVENQATDRAFRIGQRRNVLVHKFVCRGTIEERIDALIDEKTQLATDILEGGAEAMLTEMSDADLIRLVALDVDRAHVQQ